MSSSSALQPPGSLMFEGMYMVLPEPPAVREFLLDDDQLPKSPRVLADEAKPSVTQNTDGDDDTSKPDGQHRGQRRPAEDRWDCGQYWGKRHRKNQPSDVSDETWASGVSETPVADGRNCNSCMCLRLLGRHARCSCTPRRRPLTSSIICSLRWGCRIISSVFSDCRVSSGCRSQKN
jgi:hypothetical protein